MITIHSVRHFLIVIFTSRVYIWISRILLRSSYKPELKFQSKVIQKLQYLYRLAFYPPNALLLKSVVENESGLEDLIRTNFIYRFINPIKKMKLLLELEDSHELKEYLPLAKHCVMLHKHDALNYKVNLLNKDSVEIGEKIKPYCDEVLVKPTKITSNFHNYLVAGNDGIYSEYVAIVTKITKNEVNFKFNKPVVSLKNMIYVDLIFRPIREPLRYQQRALEILDQSLQMQRYLFLVNSEKCDLHFQKFYLRRTFDSSKLISKDIAKNPEQLEAVSTIVTSSSSCAPYIIFGPPGTGKTTTVVEAILQLLIQRPESRVLVTAGSNSACDTIAACLSEYFDKKVCFQALPMLRIYSKGVLQRGIRNLPQSLLKRSNIAWDNGEHSYPAVEDVKKYRIIITNLCTVGKYVRGDLGTNNHFTHVFIDEAGASSEPETLVGLMGIAHSNCRVILSGDSKQLGPIIKSKAAMKLGLGKSLMERLLEHECYAVHNNGQYDRNLQIRLRNNYRSHSEIVKLFSDLYYNSELIAKSVKSSQRWKFLPNPIFPIMFEAVYGETIKEETTSSCNKLETEVLLTYVQEILVNYGIEQTDIGIVTPYILQCDHIKMGLKKHNWQNIEVGSVENFQGREKSIIIASLVRSNIDLGFVNCPRRLNVLISRPKSLLIILGNPATLSRFNDFKIIIEICKANGNYLTRKSNSKTSRPKQQNRRKAKTPNIDEEKDNQIKTEVVEKLAVSEPKVFQIMSTSVNAPSPTPIAEPSIGKLRRVFKNIMKFDYCSIS